MEVFNKHLDNYQISQYFNDIENSEFQNLSFEEKINLLKVSLQKNINHDNLQNTLKFFHYIVTNLVKKSVADPNLNIRELGLYLSLAASEEAGAIFQPYLLVLLPDLLNLLGDKHRDVINTASHTLPLIFKTLNPYTFYQVLEFLKERINNKSWKTSIGCLKLIDNLTEVAPDQIDFLLPELIPLVTSQASSTKKELKEQSTITLNKCCQRISNPDVIPLIPKLVEANKEPNKTPNAIEALLETTFVSQVERSTLAIIVPILNRGLKDRTSKLRRQCCVIIDNMCKLVNNSQDLKPFEKELLPFIIKERDEASQPEVREMAGKSVATLEKALA